MESRHLFISHSSADAEVARALRAELEAAGYSCYLAPDDVVGTEPWAEQILAAIAASRAMIVLLSAAALRSRHVAREVELANSRGRTVLPIRIEPVNPEGSLEYHLTGVQRVDAFPLPIARHRDRILRRLGAVLEGRDPGATTQVGLPVVPPPPSVPVLGGRPPVRLGRWSIGTSSLTGIIVALAVVLLVGTGLVVFRPTAGTDASPTPGASTSAVGSPAQPSSVHGDPPTSAPSGVASAEPSPSPSVAASAAPSPTPTATPTPTPRPPTPKPPTPKPPTPPPPSPAPTPTPATNPARINSHANEATISGTSATFGWTAASGATSVRFYGLYVGTTAPSQPCPSGSWCEEPPNDPGAAYDIVLAGGLEPSQHSVLVSNLPANGSTIYVRLFTKYNPASGRYTWRDYTFTSAPLISGAGAAVGCPGGGGCSG